MLYGLKFYFITWYTVTYLQNVGVTIFECVIIAFSNSQAPLPPVHHPVLL